MNLRTMTLSPWGAFAGLSDLHREMNRLFEGFGVNRDSRFPLLNVTSDADGAVVTAEVPGVASEDLEISLEKGRLTIRVTVKDDAPQSEGTSCHLKERASGEFSRTLALPFEVEESKIAAKCEKGVLVIQLPRAERTKPRTIPVISN